MMPCSATVAEIVANSKPDAVEPSEDNIRKEMLRIYGDNDSWDALEPFIEGADSGDYKEIQEAILQAVRFGNEESYARIGRRVVAVLGGNLRPCAVIQATQKVNEE